uniref:Glycosyltransferase n=1 Tax=viral metagenome TaxID=1070528 RepID=A0A6C0CYM1_9ZZZZ
MKIILYEPGHHKNLHAIKMMCKSMLIDLEITTNYDRVLINDYDILIANSTYIPPEKIPENIKIIYGPQHWVFPKGSIVGKLNTEYSKRCVYNCLSEWIINLYLEMVPSLKVPLVSFPFAVDTDFFKPDTTQEKIIDCIIYVKRREIHTINTVLSILNSKGLSYSIFTYGQYSENDYIKTLHKSKFMISIDAHESQGFALEEAMSMNVPLLVLDARSMYYEKGDGVNSTYEYLKPKNLFCTSVPYWSDECGIKIIDTDNQTISTSIDTMVLNYKNYNPRQYILDTLSPEVCMKRILNYFYPVV